MIVSSMAPGLQTLVVPGDSAYTIADVKVYGSHVVITRREAEPL